MKNIINRTLLLMLCIAIFSCTDDSVYPVLSNEAITGTTGATNLSATDLVLDKNIGEENALTVSFSEPDFGYNSGSIRYQILFDLASGDFSSPEVVAVGSELSTSITNAELNQILINLDAEPNVPTSLLVQVETVMSTDTSLFSETTPLTVTPYSSTLDLSSIWGVVGTATPNAWDGPDLPFYQSDNDSEFVAYVTLVDGDIKIRSNNAWDVEYGDNELDGILDPGGNNISVTAGSYKIIFNSTTLAYSVESYSWGLVGSATPNAWDGPDLNLEYDSYSDQWRALVTLADGDIKIRSNNSWSVEYGDNEPDGTLDIGGSNIPVTAGNYLVTVNLNDLSYSVVETDIWGVVGSATPNNWDGPDIKFSLDFSKENAWILEGAELTDGDIKIRSNNAWDVEYGDNEPDGILDSGGNNIPVTAGTYNLTLDFADPNNPLYTITPQ